MEAASKKHILVESELMEHFIRACRHLSNDEIAVWLAILLLTDGDSSKSTTDEEVMRVING